jgi:hypothetical protein
MVGDLVVERATGGDDSGVGVCPGRRGLGLYAYDRGDGVGPSLQVGHLLLAQVVVENEDGQRTETMPTARAKTMTKARDRRPWKVLGRARDIGRAV